MDTQARCALLARPFHTLPPLHRLQFFEFLVQSLLGRAALVLFPGLQFELSMSRIILECLTPRGKQAVRLNHRHSDSVAMIKRNLDVQSLRQC